MSVAKHPPTTSNCAGSNLDTSPATTEQFFSLRWNNYQTNFTSVFHQLLESQSFVDVTLACESSTLQVHKVVLSACSSYFKRILLENPCKHPTIIMPAEIAFEDLRSIIEFIYRGEIDVPEGSLQGILHTAEQLQIKGLSDIQELGDFSADMHAEMTANQTTSTELPVHTARQNSQHNDLQSTVGALNSVQAQASRAADAKLTSDPRSATQHGARRQRAKRMRPYPAGATTCDTQSASVQTDHRFTTTNNVATADAHKWAFTGDHGDLQSDDANDSGGSNVYITTAESLVDGSEEGSGCDADGGATATVAGDALMGESMGYLDFAAEPAAPAATPVTEHVEQIDGGRGLSGIKTIGDNGNVVRGTATPAKTVTMQFQTLLPMEHDQSASTLAARTKNAVSFQSTSHQLHTLHHPQRHNHQQHQQQQQQTINVGAPASTVNIVSTPCDTIIISGTEPEMQQHAADHIIHMHSVDLLDDGTTQEITIDPEESIMDIDHTTIKQEQHQHHHQQDGNVVEVAANDESQQTMPDSRMVTMMTSGGHLVEMYQSDSSDDSKITDMHDPIQLDCGDENDNHPIDDDGEDDHDDQHSGSPLKLPVQHHHIPTTGGGQTPAVATITRLAQPAVSLASSSATSAPLVTVSPKTWTQANMDSALEALRAQTMSLTRASVTFGIPSTTLWQRAHRLGIDTPKKEGPSKTWSDDSLNNALEALRNGEISANKASKAYGIPSSTLYKIARREGIRLAAPFNAAPTNWSVDDLERALESIRSGATSVQKASLEFGIPTGTLYGRCKREGIELSRSNPTPWSEENMMEALESVRLGHQSINQAAIHYNLPYSSLYGRFKRGKFDVSVDNGIINPMDQSLDNSSFEFSPNASNFEEQQAQTDQPQVVYRMKTEQS